MQSQLLSTPKPNLFRRGNPLGISADGFSYAIIEEGAATSDSYTGASGESVVDIILASGVTYVLVVKGCGVVQTLPATPCVDVIPCKVSAPFVRSAHETSALSLMDNVLRQSR